MFLTNEDLNVLEDYTISVANGKIAANPGTNILYYKIPEQFNHCVYYFYGSNTTNLRSGFCSSLNEGTLVNNAYYSGTQGENTSEYSGVINTRSSSSNPSNLYLVWAENSSFTIKVFIY